MTAIRVGCSTKMTTRGETELIRMSKKLREKLGLEPQMIIIVEQNKAVLRLRVRPSYEEDLVGPEAEDIALLNKTNFDLLTQEGTEISIREVCPFSGITLGADPECFIYNEQTGYLHVAEAAFKEHVKIGLIDTLGFRVGEAGYAGWDGGHMLCEFRPDPVNSNEKEKLVDNLRKLINFCIHRFPKHWSLLAHTYIRDVAAGFHLHFGLPEVYITGKGQTGCGPSSKVEELVDKLLLPHQLLGKLVTEALNFFIGIPLILSDHEQRDRVWHSTKYGKYGDALKHHQYTLEYRIPGGRNLLSPRTTSNLVSASHLVVANSVALLKELTHNYNQAIIKDEVKLKKMFTEALGLNSLDSIKKILDQEIVPTKEQAQHAFGIIKDYFTSLPNYTSDGAQFMDDLENNILYSNLSLRMNSTWGDSV